MNETRRVTADKGSLLVFAVYVTHERRRGVSWSTIARQLRMNAQTVQERFEKAVETYGEAPG